MTARVITITSGKGGVGKTTTTANVGVALALLGKRVVCLDGDIGLRNLDVVLGLENRIVYDLVDVIEGRCKLRQAMIKDKRLPELNLVCVPEGIDDAWVRSEALKRYGLELGNGLGVLAGKVWRIGLMGTSSTSQNVQLCLEVLETLVSESAPA